MEAAAAERVAGTRSDNPAVQYFWGAKTMRFARLAQRSTAFIDILTDPFYLSIADGVLGPQSVDYWMNTGQMMIIGPGERGQVIHRDADNWRTMCRPDGFEVTLSCMFAITDFTAADFIDHGHFTPAGSAKFAARLAPGIKRLCAR